VRAALRIGAILVLTAAALYFAVRLPIPTPTGAPGVEVVEGARRDPELGPTAPSTLPALTTTEPGSAPAGPPAPAGTTESSAVAPTPCEPARFALPALGIDAGVVRVGVTPDGGLGTPADSDKTRAGWFPSVLAGAERGTVLMDGHTYRDESALFTTTFERQVQVGMVLTLSCSTGQSFRYRISDVVADLTADRYPAFVEDRDLYSATGPAQVVMVTCADYDPARRVWRDRMVLVATPVA
jgi:hypothetical protein